MHRVSAGFEGGAEEGAGRTFAVGAGNVENRWQRIMRASQPVEQLSDAVEPEAVAARRKQGQAFELCPNGRMIRPREVRHQAAFFFSGVR
jgi:hypothetical protein